MTSQDFTQLGYSNAREVPHQGWCGIMPQLFTTGLFVGLDETGWQRRYCFKHLFEAETALLAWTGEGDPPGPWLKEKPSNRRGPGLPPELAGKAVPR